MNDNHDAQPLVYSTYGADPDLADLVDAFVAEMPGRIAAILDFAHRDDWAMVTRLAHQLKGAAGSYGFHQITPAAAHLETAVRDRAEHEEVWAAIDSLCGLADRVRNGTPHLPDLSGSLDFPATLSDAEI